MPQNNPPSGKLSHHQTIDKMTSDAYKRGGQKQADDIRRRATNAAIRADRDRK